MPIDITADDSVVRNDVTVSGAPAVRIAGNNVRFTNASPGMVSATTAGVAALVIEGSGAIVENEAGAYLTRSSWTDVVVRGSAFADTLVNAGYIFGRVELGEGNDSFTQRNAVTRIGVIDLGAGDDLYVQDVASASITTTEGGAGFDVLRVTAGAYFVNSGLTGSAATGYERLQIEKAANIWSLTGFSGFQEVSLVLDGGYNFIASVNPNADLAIAGGSLFVGSGSVFRSIAGGIGEDLVAVWSGSVTGNVALGGGNDQFSFQQLANNPTAPSVGGTVDGGAGTDTLTITFEKPATLDLSQFLSFEKIMLSTKAFTAGGPLRITNVDGYTQIGVTTGSELVFADSYSPTAVLSFSTARKVTLEASVTVAALNAAIVGGDTNPTPSGSGTTAINQGVVLGNVFLTRGNDVYDGSLGSVGGALYAYAGDDRATGGSGDDRFYGGYGADILDGGGGNDTLDGGAGDDDLTGGPGEDILYLQGGGTDRASGGAGRDAFLFGATMTSADTVDGGSEVDQLGIQGDYTGANALTLGAMTNIEQFFLLAGNDTRFGDPGTGSYSYEVTSVDGNVAAGGLLQIDANRLRAGENFTFDGSAESDGALLVWGGKGVETITGGAGNDGFLFRGNGNWGGQDRVDGGAGANDQLGIRGNYLGADAIVMGAEQISGIETLVFMSGTDIRFGPAIGDAGYDVTMDDGNVAAGQRMTIDAGSLREGEVFLFDGSAELDGSFRIFGGRSADVIVGGAAADSLRGGNGGDTLSGGGSADLFVYRGAAESRSESFDTLTDFDSAEDRIDLPTAVSGWAGAVTGGTLSAANFDADVAAALAGALGPNQALLFRPDEGELAGRTFLIVDGNGDGAYQADQDYVFALGGAAQIDTSSSAMFV